MSETAAANNTYDVIVIGGGPAGETAAGRCGDHGLSVVLVERELVGGECSYWGCIPSKTLAAARATWSPPPAGRLVRPRRHRPDRRRRRVRPRATT